MTSILYLQSPDLLVSNKEELGFRGGDWFEIRNSYSYSISYSYSNLKVPIAPDGATMIEVGRYKCIIYIFILVSKGMVALMRLKTADTDLSKRN